MTWPSDPNRWQAPAPKGPAGRLTPLRVMQIVEIGVIAFRRHWRPLVAGTAVLATIPLLLGDLAQVRLGDVVSADVKLDASGFPLPIPSDLLGEIATAIGLVIATELLSSAFLMLASLLASVYVARDYRGEPTSLSDGVRARCCAAHRSRSRSGSSRRPSASESSRWPCSWRSSRTLVLPPAAGSVGGPGALIALIAIVGGLVAFAIISIRFLVAPVAAVLEPDGPMKAMRRSWHLTGENAWRTFGLVAAVSITVSVHGRDRGGVRRLAHRGVRERLEHGGGPRAGDRHRPGLFTAPILPVMETVLYFDLRVRRDGLTLPLPAEAVEGQAARLVSEEQPKPILERRGRLRLRVITAERNQRRRRRRVGFEREGALSDGAHADGSGLELQEQVGLDEVDLGASLFDLGTQLSVDAPPPAPAAGKGHSSPRSRGRR